MFDADNPFALLAAWLKEAEAAEPNDPTAMTLATLDAEGLPDARIVLLKGLEHPAEEPGGGLAFYTNYDSRKGLQLSENPVAAVVWHWKSLRRQVRARGAIERVGADQSDQYYATRPVQSRIGAAASRQSQPLESRESLKAEVDRLSAQYPEGPPRPETWGGFRIRPIAFEFWADGAYRLHDRFRWTRADAQSTQWTVQRLYP